MVTATPSATPGPKTLWGEYGDNVVTGLIGLIAGGILVWLLKPASERLGNALANRLSRLGAGRGFRQWYLDYLIDEYRCLNIRGLHTRAPVAIELEQVYVSLQAEVPDAELESAARRSFTIGQLGLKPPPGFFDGQLQAGECLLLLDGLDEVADERERRQMAGWVDRLVSTYPRNRYIVTSRPVTIRPRWRTTFPLRGARFRDGQGGAVRAELVPGRGDGHPGRHTQGPP